MKTYTPVYFIKKLLIFLIILIPVSIFIMNLTVVRAEDNNTKETGADELNKARKQFKDGGKKRGTVFLKVPNDEWPTQVIFDTTNICYQGTVRWIAMGNPNLLNQAPPYPIARAMTIHCFCVLDKLRTEYRYTPYVDMLSADDPLNPQKLPNKFMEKSVQCIREHDTLAGLIILDPNFNMEDLGTIKQKDNEIKIDKKVEKVSPDDNSGKLDSPEQPKELPTDTPLLNF
tara:strand:+ start:339 stop:1025 length:687 start_codon:yes stop_codon:yes gene_type:complete